MKKTTDIWFSAFLIKKGYTIVSYNVISRGKISCCFNLTDDEWQALKLEFHNSDISQYKMIIDKIKDLAF